MPDEQTTLPPQQQDRPGSETMLEPAPETKPRHPGADKLLKKVALITGGDSGIGRAVALAYANEGADVSIVYLAEDDDAQETKRLVEEHGRKCLILKGDVRQPEFCQQAVNQTAEELGGLNILVNNAAEQTPQADPAHISPQQLDDTFRTNVYGYFYMVQAALPHLTEGDAIINTTSVTAYKGSPALLDYSSTKGAIVSFTRSLSQSLIEQGIRVNGVAPGPIWTPLIASTFSPGKVAHFGADVPMKRPGQPNEVASCYVFLASDDASYIAGQILHPNGGTVVNG